MRRVLLDVNVLVSVILIPHGVPRQVFSAWENGRFALLASEGMIAELVEKLSLPRITRRYHISAADLAWIRRLLLNEAEVVLVPPGEVREITGDPEDDYVLATARLGRVEVLVSGDHGLLALGQYAGTQILSPRHFLTVLEGEEA